MRIGQEARIIREPTLSKDFPRDIFALELIRLKKSYCIVAPDSLHMDTLPVAVCQVCPVRRNCPAPYRILGRTEGELCQLQVRDRLRLTLHKPKAGSDRADSDYAKDGHEPASARGICSTLSSTQLVRGRRQAGAHFRCCLVALSSLLLERFVDDRFQFRRDARVQLPNRHRGVI